MKEIVKSELKLKVSKVKEIVKSELKLKVSKVDVSLRSAVYKKDRIPQTLVTSHFSHFSHFTL